MDHWKKIYEHGGNLELYRIFSKLQQFMYTIIVTSLGGSSLRPKYLRKWFYNFLILNNVPESVAYIIEGRAPESVGSMHYLANVKQADYWYRISAKRIKENSMKRNLWVHFSLKLLFFLCNRNTHISIMNNTRLTASAMKEGGFPPWIIRIIPNK